MAHPSVGPAITFTGKLNEPPVLLEVSALVSFDLTSVSVVDGIRYLAKSKTCKDANCILLEDVITSRTNDTH